MVNRQLWVLCENGEIVIMSSSDINVHEADLYLDYQLSNAKSLYLDFKSQWMVMCMY